MTECKTIKEVMTAHKMMPKEFSEVTGMNYGTCGQIHKGEGSKSFDVFALWLHYALSRGKTIDILKREVRK